MKINKFLVFVIIVLAAGLAVLLALAVKGSDARTGPENSSTGQESGTVSGDEHITFPKEINIVSLVVSDRDPLEPSDFVSAPAGIDYTVEYAKAPDLSVRGWQDIVLRFHYKGNLFQRSAKVYAFHIETERTYELASYGTAAISDFIDDSGVNAVFAEPASPSLNLSVPGKRSVNIAVNDRYYSVTVNVADTTAPTATPVEQTVTAGQTLPASAFVVNVTDASRVETVFETEPQWNVKGDHPVTVILTDLYGNRSSYSTVLHVGDKTGYPVFSGLDTIKICEGDTISYRSGVTCTDEKGNSVAFTIDASGVDRNRQGTYQAVYTATDSAGNTAQKTRTVIVKAISKELVDELCDKILAEIIKDSYSTDEKIKAVWRWTKQNITYVGTSVSYDDELRVAYAAFDTHSGDCYTYYISNKYMLDRLGIPNIEVKRVASVTRHWWNLVKFSNGKWYHIDSCAHPASLDRSTYKMTESDLKWFTEQFKTSRHPNYYEYDHTLPIYDGINIAQ
ncbi:MAG: transglutaminase domain-containing protein [Clostridia bacterium]|nr:transglutaminase domain-containing protein [Clostridia bacterium]